MSPVLPGLAEALSELEQEAPLDPAAEAIEMLVPDVCDECGGSGQALDICGVCDNCGGLGYHP